MEASALTAWIAYSDVEADFMADGTSGDFFRYEFGQGGTPAAAQAASLCASTRLLHSNFVLNSPGTVGGTLGPYSPTSCDGTQYQVRMQVIETLL